MILLYIKCVCRDDINLYKDVYVEMILIYIKCVCRDDTTLYKD